jgi:hypothetical protein
MELVSKFTSKVILGIVFLFLSSCASTDIDEAEFESTEEETRRVLDDAYVVEQQKKLKEYQPDKVKLKTISPEKNALKAPSFALPKSKVAKSKGGAVDKSYLSQTATWKDQDLKSYDLWKLFSPSYIKVKEKHVLSASYTGINAASIIIEVKPPVRYQSRDVYHFQARAQTADFYKWVYSLNDVVDSLVDKQHFVSLKYSLIQKEKNKEIDDIQFYDRNTLMTFSHYKKKKKDKVEESKKEAEIPFFGQDYFSSLFFVRGLPLNDKDHYFFPTTTKSQTWLMSIKVLAREKKKIGIGEFKAIKLELITKYTGDLAKKGPITIWLHDDETRALLAASAEVKIGSIKVELSQYYQDNKLILGEK